MIFLSANKIPNNGQDHFEIRDFKPALTAEARSPREVASKAL
jgi:hypothetical protein